MRVYLAVALAACGGGHGHSADGGDSGTGITGDTFIPWEGGPGYWSTFPHGPPTDPAFFPIAVFWQSSSNAAAYKAIGINTDVTYNDATELAALDQAGMYALADQTMVAPSAVAGTAHVVGWIQQDEPDNAQPCSTGYCACIDPTQIQSLYTMFRTADASRPVYLNTGQGTAWHDYYGRGSACAGRVDMYAQYAQGADLLDFDIYPANSTDATTHDNLYYVALGVDTLRDAGQMQKPVWAWIESTDIQGTGNLPTAAQMRNEVWSALVHEARGFGYFCHVFQPSFDEAGLLHTPSTKAAAAAIDAEVTSLAPELNTQSIANWGTVASSNAATPVDVMVKRAPDATYVFATAMRGAPTTAMFSLERFPATATSVEVIGESRTIPVAAGAFSDAFDGYGVHLYRIAY